MGRGLLAAVVAWFCAAVAGAPRARAAVVFDRASERSANASTITVDHTVGTGAGRYLVVAIAVEGSATAVSRVDFAGATVVSHGATDSPADECGIELLGLVAPPSGTQQLTVRLAGRRPTWVFVASYSGVDQVDPTGARFWDHGNGAASALAVTSTVGDLVVDQVCVGGASGLLPPSPAAGQTARATATSGSAGAGLGDLPGAASVSLGWRATASGAPAWAAAAVSLRPSDPPLPPPDAGRDAAPADAAQLDAGGDAATPDAGPPDVPGPEGPGVAEDAGIASDALAVADLTVGCACRTAPAAGAPAGVTVLLAAVLAFFSLRRVRSSPGRVPRARGEAPRSWRRGSSPGPAPRC
jgi:MYXO-CTERM domain-containing protein